MGFAAAALGSFREQREVQALNRFAAFNGQFRSGCGLRPRGRRFHGIRRSRSGEPHFLPPPSNSDRP